jgi:sortase A
MIIRMEGRALASLRRLLRGSYLLLFVAGAVLLAVPIYHLSRAYVFQTYQDHKFRKQTTEVREPKADPEPKKTVSTPETDAATLDSSPPVSAKPVVPPTPSPGDVLGRLEIPRLRTSVMILQGTEDEQLKLGIGHVEDTAHPGQVGNVALVAHRDTFFRPLKNIRKHDEIRVVTATTTMHYYVELTKVIGPFDTDVLDPTAGAELTLITCYPFDFVGKAPMRFLVRAVAARNGHGVDRPVAGGGGRSDD